MKSKLIKFLAVSLASMSLAACNQHVDPAPEDVYVEEIKIILPEQTLDIEDRSETKDGKTEYEFSTHFNENGGEGITVVLKAEVYPTNTSFKRVEVVTDEQEEGVEPMYTVNIVDMYYIHVHFNTSARAKFAVQSTDGNKLQVPVTIFALPS